MFTRVNFTCMYPCMPIKTSLIGETITANVTNKCLWSNRMIQDVLCAVCEAAEHFAAVLARVRSIVVVVVHMFPQVGLPSERLVADIAHELPLTVADRTGRSYVGFRGGHDTDFAVFSAGFRGELFARNRCLCCRTGLLFVWRARSMPSSVRRQVGRAAENLVALWASIFGVLNSATLVLSKRKRIRVHFLAELADELRLWQRPFGLGKIVLVLVNGKLLVFKNCGFATVIRVFFVERFASGTAAAIFTLVRFLSALD